MPKRKGKWHNTIQRVKYFVTFVPCSPKLHERIRQTNMISVTVPFKTNPLLQIRFYISLFWSYEINVQCELSNCTFHSYLFPYKTFHRICDLRNFSEFSANQRRKIFFCGLGNFFISPEFIFEDWKAIRKIREISSRKHFFL